ERGTAGGAARPDAEGQGSLVGGGGEGLHRSAHRDPEADRGLQAAESLEREGLPQGASLRHAGPRGVAFSRPGDAGSQATAWSSFAAAASRRRTETSLLIPGSSIVTP